jgi:hypothetical protein
MGRGDATTCKREPGTLCRCGAISLIASTTRQHRCVAASGPRLGVGSESWRWALAARATRNSLNEPRQSCPPTGPGGRIALSLLAAAAGPAQKQELEVPESTEYREAS